MTATMTDVIWRPSAEYLKCRVLDYMKEQGLTDINELIRKSAEDTDWFWSTALDYVGMRWYTPYSKLMDDSAGFAWTKWFIDGELNIVDNCLDYHLDTKNSAHRNRPKAGPNHIAVIGEAEGSEPIYWTYAELNEKVCKVASALRKLGVKKGDSVGIYMPMVAEVVAVLFACLKIGAVAVPVFSGFGGEALKARMADAECKVLFTADGGLRRGKKILVKPDADEAASAVPSIKHVIVLDRFGMSNSWTEGRDLKWDDIVEKADLSIQNRQTEVLPAEHPSMYLYTSGTTGKPKGTVHTHAGALATIAKELGFAFDVHKEDVFFWFTDIGWMMGPWEMIGVAYWGGTMVIAEGAPNYPTTDRIWQMVERYKVSMLGISPTAVRVLRAEGDEWVDKHPMESLRLTGSTGEPWDIDSYMWFFNRVCKKRVPIINISGGTELVGCLIQPLPAMPIKPCSLGAPGLGMDVDVVDEEGKSIRDGIGHLVCRKPSPSMTKGFLKDPQRYIDTYFSKFPDIWYHGDWAKIDADGSWFLFGRSDDTIKIAGKRLGPGEVESILVEHKLVAEACAIGVPHAVKGEGLVCFAVLMPGIESSNELAGELRNLIGQKIGNPLKPEAVYFVKALPKTRSGKIVRGTIRKKYLGEDLGDLASVDNKESLDFIPLAK